MFLRSDRGAYFSDHSYRHPFSVPAAERVACQCSKAVRTQTAKPKRSFLSVVVPARDEAGSLPELIAEIVAAMRSLCDAEHEGLGGYEIIVVDDGSTDTTPSVLGELTALHPELRGLILGTNVGQSAAIMAGIDAAAGDWIATLDADLQNDPADLVRLWQALPGDNAASLGWRVKRQDKWSRCLIGILANRLRNLVLGQTIRDTGCSIRIFPRKLALRLPMFRGMHRFIGSLLLREGCELVQLPVYHRARCHGRSHYDFWNRFLQTVFDLIGMAWLMSRRIEYEVVKTQGWLEPPVEADPHIIDRVKGLAPFSHCHREN